jgi:Mediator of RNA polymerase II transcription subunit 1
VKRLMFYIWAMVHQRTNLGVPEFCKKSLCPIIYFWLHPNSRNNYSVENAERVVVSIEYGAGNMTVLPKTQPQYIVTPEVKNQDLGIVEVPILHGNTNMYHTPCHGKLPIIYVMTLSNPLVTSKTIYDQLVTYSTGVPAIEQILGNPSVSYEQFIVKSPLTQIKKIKKSRVDGSRPNAYNQNYVLQNSETSSVICIKKIPFSHPQNILTILQLLRAQRVFDELLWSLFSKAKSHWVEIEVPSNPGNPNITKERLNFEIQDCLPPSKISVFFSNVYNICFLVDIRTSAVSCTLSRFSQETGLVATSWQPTELITKLNRNLYAPEIIHHICQELKQ